jgi:hypothetical protein
MNLPDLNPTTIASTVSSPAPEIASPAISADIRAIQSWRERELELAAIREFGRDWDGRGSDAPTVSAMEAAALFLAIWKKNFCESPPARISLSPSGFLSADWLEGDALVRAEIMDLESNEIEWMRAIPGQPTEFVTTALMDRKGSRTEQVQTWQPGQAEEEELAFACGR